MTRVIASTDFSEASLIGVRAARDHAQRLGATLVLVHVWDRGALALHSPYLKSVQAENVAMMNEIEESLAKELEGVRHELLEGVVGVSTSILDDRNPARGITRFAKPEDVIVIATHGRTGFSRALLGSVAEKVVRLAPCQVLTVPARGAGEE